MIQELIQGIKNCACGRDHYCPVERIVIGADAMEYAKDLKDRYTVLWL